MKILLATDNYYPNVNGASYFVQRLAVQLQARGHEVLVVAPSRAWYHEVFQHEGVRIVGIASWPLERIRGAWPFATAPALRRLLADFKPECIHTQSHFVIGRRAVALGRELGVPTLGTNHFMPENLVHYFHLPPQATPFLIKAAWRHFLITFNQVDAVTSPTNVAAAILKRIGLSKTPAVVSNGIDLTRFTPGHRGEHLRAKYRMPVLPTLLYVGRLDKEKNLDFLLRALALVPASVALHLVLVGAGAERGRLRQLAQGLGLAERVTFTGFVPDSELPDLYALADCFVMPGTVELQSIATMEAMATGLPVIAANTLALPELVQHNKNGFLYHHGKAQELADQITLMFTEVELRERLGRASLELIQVHSISTVVEQFEALYQQLIKAHSHAS